VTRGFPIPRALIEMTHPDIPTNSIQVITSKELGLLHSNGFKLVPLSDNHKLEIWGPIYDDPFYWKVNDFTSAEISSKFKNIASALGKTHIQDPEGNDLYLQVLFTSSCFSSPSSMFVGKNKSGAGELKLGTLIPCSTFIPSSEILFVVDITKYNRLRIF
jgi:hypothetical protein